LALYDIHGPHDHGHVHVHVHDHDHSILSIRVDRFNPTKTSESSNSRPKGFSVARGQGDPWSIEYITDSLSCLTCVTALYTTQSAYLLLPKKYATIPRSSLAAAESARVAKLWHFPLCQPVPFSQGDHSSISSYCFIASFGYKWRSVISTAMAAGLAHFLVS
jgi:hypothetical protein